MARSDRDECERILRQGSKSFYAASRLLPPRVRYATVPLYAFCREADDAIDTAVERERAVSKLEARLEAMYSGRPKDNPVDRELCLVIEERRLPRAAFEALLEGFEWDAEQHRYNNLSELEAYSVRVASTVGVLMACLMGVRTRAALARACELGVAMQLTNIARDIGEDARAGRLYIPREWLGELGVDVEAWLGNPEPTEPIKAVTQRLLNRANELYVRADAGIGLLPADCRGAIRAARLIYSEIAQVIAANGYDSVTRRAVTGKGRKVALAARGFTWSVRPPPPDVAFSPPIDSAVFLIEAVLS